MIGCCRVMERRVVAQQNHLNTLQPHDSIGLGPAPIIANAHSNHAAESSRYRESKVADLEIRFLQMLESAPRLVVGMARQVNFAILECPVALFIDEDRGVEAPYLASFFRQLCIAQSESDTDLLCFFEQRRRLDRGHLAFEEQIDVGLFFKMPAWEKCREGKLGICDDIAPGALC